MRGTRVWLAGGVFALACGGSDTTAPSADAPRPSVVSTTSTSTTGMTRPTAPPPPPVATPEDARRFLEERGIDPQRLSEDVAEQMRRRFRPETVP